MADDEGGIPAEGSSPPPDWRDGVPPFDPDLKLITYIERSQLPPGEGPWWLPKRRERREATVTPSNT